MRETLRKLKFILTAREQSQVVGLIFMMLIGGILELLGVAGVFPIISAITGEVSSNSRLNLFGNIFTGEHRIIVMCLVLIGIYVLKNLYLAFMYRTIFAFVYKGRSNLSIRMFDIYMKEPYSFHLQRNLAIIQRAVRSDVDGCYALLRAVLQMTAEGVICIILGGLLFFTDPFMASLLIVLLAFCVGIVLIVSKKTVRRLGQEDAKHAGEMNKWLMQGISGIKEIKLLGREDFFTDSFSDHSRKSSECNQKQQLISLLPRMFTETVCITGIMLWIIIVAVRGVSLVSILPSIAVFAVAAFRLLPSVGKINGLLSEYQFYKSRVDFIYEDMQGILSEKINVADDKNANLRSDVDTNGNVNTNTVTMSGRENSRKTKETRDGRNASRSLVSGKTQEAATSREMELHNEISVSGLTFAYEGIDKNVFSDVTFTINKGESIGIVGPSGAGKTTFVDVLMGLLTPTAGDIKVDEQSVYKDIDKWYRCLGYVPQSIYLSDDSIKNNIAFGVRPDEIDEERIKDVIRQAQLQEFVEQLPQGIDTVVGDRGVRLSGGQRQRIGIARALYVNPKVLILDEATSALDNDTEAAVMEAIEKLHGQITMIIIAHRLSTIESCDRVFEIKEGKILAGKND